MEVHVADVEARRIGDPCGDLLAVDDGRGRQEAALTADLDPVGTRQADGGVGVRGDVRVELGGRDLGGPEGDLAVGSRRRVGDVPLEVEEAVVRRVQQAQAVGLRLKGDRRIGDAVDDRRVVELLHADGDVGRARDLGRLAERVGLVLPGGRDVEVAVRIEVWVGDRAVRRRGRRPEPRPVHPAAVGAHARRITGVLGRHVDVVVPEAALGAPASRVPGGILEGELGGIRDEGPVLDDERDPLAHGLVGPARAEEPLLGRVGDHVAGGLAGVDVQAGDAPRVVVVEEQPRALLVGVVEGLAAVGRAVADVHIWDVLHADALRPRRVLAGGGDPLVRRPVADPGGRAAVEVQGRPVVLETPGALRVLAAHRVTDIVHDRALVDGGGHVHRAHAGAHQGAVGREEQVAVRPGREQVVEDDPDRAILGRDDRGAEPLGRGDGEPLGDAVGLHDRGLGPVKERVRRREVLADAGVRCRLELDVAADERVRQAGREVGAVLHEADDVLVGFRAVVRLGLGNGERDVLAARRAGRRHAQAWQVVRELLDALRHVAGAGVVDGDRSDRSAGGRDGGGRRRARAGPRVAERHGGGGRVAGAERVEDDALDDERRRRAGLEGRDRRADGTVVDRHARGRRVAGAGGVDDDAVDGDQAAARGGAEGILDARSMAGGREASGIVRQAELDHRHRVAAVVGPGDQRGGVDAAEGRRRGVGRGTAAGDGDGRRRIATTTKVDGDRIDDAAVVDHRGRRSTRAGAGDGDGRRRGVAAARGRDVDREDGARLRVDGRGCGGTGAATATQGHGDVGQPERAVGPVRVGPEVVGNLGFVGRVGRPGRDPIGCRGQTCWAHPRDARSDGRHEQRDGGHEARQFPGHAIPLLALSQAGRRRCSRARRPPVDPRAPGWATPGDLKPHVEEP